MAGRSADWTVKIAFDLSANGQGSWFTLDDSTKGKLDDATYPLAGDVLVDVTSKVKQLTIRRGRSRMLEQFTAGAANIVLKNDDRTFDPSYTSGPYYGQLVPRKSVEIKHANEFVFVGNVEDWNYSYRRPGFSDAEPSCVDGFGYLARQNYGAGTSTEETTGVRVGKVLDGADWPAAKRSIATGTRTAAADVRTQPENALTYAQKMETTEGGALFVARNGTMTFLSSATPSYSGIVFGGSGSVSGIPFIDYGVQYGTEEMWNSVTVTYFSGSTPAACAYVADDTSSQSTYGMFEQKYDTMLTGSTAASGLAHEILAGYGTPKYRVNKVVVDMAGISSAQRLSVLQLDLGSVVRVLWTPRGVGNAISEYCVIDQIEHDATTDSYRVTFALSESDYV
jgi:hypothetical protein